jgi:osmotically-inducible protein OsmY
MRLLAIVLVLVGLQGCSSMLLGNNSSDDSAPGSGQASSQSSADIAIAGSVREQYSADADISKYVIGVRSNSGRVTLTGTVGSYNVRDRVVDIAHNTHGVVSVDSRVVVNTNL